MARRYCQIIIDVSATGDIIVPSFGTIESQSIQRHQSQTPNLTLADSIMRRRVVHPPTEAQVAAQKAKEITRAHKAALAALEQSFQTKMKATLPPITGSPIPPPSGGPANPLQVTTPAKRLDFAPFAQAKQYSPEPPKSVDTLFSTKHTSADSGSKAVSPATPAIKWQDCTHWEITSPSARALCHDAFLRLSFLLVHEKPNSGLRGDPHHPDTASMILLPRAPCQYI